MKEEARKQCALQGKNNEYVLAIYMYVPCAFCLVHVTSVPNGNFWFLLLPSSVGLLFYVLNKDKFRMRIFTAKMSNATDGRSWSWIPQTRSLSHFYAHTRSAKQPSTTSKSYAYLNFARKSKHGIRWSAAERRVNCSVGYRHSSFSVYTLLYTHIAHSNGGNTTFSVLLWNVLRFSYVSVRILSANTHTHSHTFVSLLFGFCGAPRSLSIFYFNWMPNTVRQGHEKRATHAIFSPSGHLRHGLV